VAVAVLVIVMGLIFGVAIELVLSRRHRARRDIVSQGDPETIEPAPPRLPQPRFIDDGEGFRILGPVEYDEPDSESLLDSDEGPEGDSGLPRFDDH